MCKLEVAAELLKKLCKTADMLLRSKLSQKVKDLKLQNAGKKFTITNMQIRSKFVDRQLLKCCLQVAELRSMTYKNMRKPASVRQQE